MRLRRYVVMGFFLFCAAGVRAGDFADIFPGTLLVWQDQPVLIRCDLGQSAYILVDANMRTAPWLEQINKLDASLASPVSAVVVGSYRKVDGKNHLVVKSIEKIRKGHSCHLVPPHEPFNF